MGFNAISLDLIGSNEIIVIFRSNTLGSFTSKEVVVLFQKVDKFCLLL